MYIGELSVGREVVVENDVNVFIVFIVDRAPQDLLGFLGQICLTFI